MDSAIKIIQLQIKSSAFESGAYIPSRYTCEGDNVNPPITIENIPVGTKSLVIIIEDPDAAKGTFNHWTIWNIRPVVNIIENTAPGVEGKNGFGTMSYQGPCPPEGTAHRYFFKVYGLDTLLDLSTGSDSHKVENAMKDHVVAEGTLMGLYKRTKFHNL